MRNKPNSYMYFFGQMQFLLKIISCTVGRIVCHKDEYKLHHFSIEFILNIDINEI